MTTALIPVKWYWTSGASGPLPCKWEGYWNGRLITVVLMGGLDV